MTQIAGLFGRQLGLTLEPFLAAGLYEKPSSLSCHAISMSENYFQL